MSISIYPGTPDNGEGGVTPGRSSSVTFDLTEQVTIEPGLSVARRGAEVAKHLTERVTDGEGGDFGNLRYWGSGHWSLRPIQEDLTNLHEYSAGTAHILAPGDFSLIQLLAGTAAYTTIQAQPVWAKSLLLNMNYSGSISTSGDGFMAVRLPAGVDMDPTNPTVATGNAALTSSQNSPPLDGLDVPLDRCGVSNDSFSADQGFFLRFYAPGVGAAHLRYLWSFFFGQYVLVFEGDGKAQLWEYCQDAFDTWQYRKRAAFRYAKAANVSDQWHNIAIYPHIGPGGSKLIAFANNQLDAATVFSTFDRTDQRDVAPTEFIYRASPLTRGTDKERSASHVTVASTVGFDIRRGLRLQFQISKLAFATSATLIDRPATNGPRTENTNGVQVIMDYLLPSGTTLTPTVKDATTSAVFVPGTNTQPYCEFAFTGDGTTTPTLFGYNMAQAARTGTIEPGAFTATAQNYSITPFSGDMQDVSAQVSILDPTNAYSRLAIRAQLSARITTTYTPPGEDATEQTIALFRGYASRCRSTRRGNNTGNDYPAQDWREYACAMQGMGTRLFERVSGAIMRAYGKDDPTIHPSVTIDPLTGDYPPWKVTDLLVDVLLECGFAESQIDIPDLSYRIWPGQAGKVDDQVVNPGTNYGELLTRMARNYVGAGLYYNEQVGDDGAWQLLFGTQPGDDGTFTPIYNFVTDPAAGKIQHIAGAYPDATTFITGHPSFVTIPPDFNYVFVSTDEAQTSTNNRVQTMAAAYNVLSYAVPGSSVTPDPDHPDYLGRCRPLTVLDPSLRGFTPEQTWAALRWTARRLYDYLCHAQVITHFIAPLVFIYDATISKYRPLRHQDPVSIDGDPSWLVKSMTINYTLDKMQMCEYECIKPFPGQVFAGMDGLKFKRNNDRRAALSATGHSSRSNLYGLLGVAANREASMLELPHYTKTATELQNADGTWAGDWTDYENATRGL